MIDRDANNVEMTGNWKSGADVIIRVHDATRTNELDRALFSLFNQSFSPVHAIIVTQNFDEADSKSIGDVLNKYEWTTDHVSPSLINFSSEPGQDARSKLLNVGISLAQYRFLAILDFDDYLYQDAYDFLIGELVKRNAAIVFGGIVIKHVRAFKSHVYNLRRMPDRFPGSSLAELMIGNFCPIHSFVIDRSLILPEDLYFEESLTRLEDYDFLLRICTKYAACFETRAQIVGVYNWHVDGKNSIQVFEADDQKRLANAREWSQAEQHILELKARGLTRQR